MATQEITISELELADEILGDMNIPVDTATETRAVTLKQLRAWLGSALPVGSIFASVGRIDDERYTLLDGKTISRTGTYEAFCNKVVEKVQAGTWKACTEEEFNLEVSETGQCGKFVVSNDYVRIPKLGNSLCSGVIDGKIPVVGNGMTLGLTNGTNYYGLQAGEDGQNRYILSSGMYGQTVGTGSNVGDVPTIGAHYGITTDPTKSGIEGKINSVEVFYYMVISTEGQTSPIEIDINKVYEDINLKANSDLSNVASVASSFKEASVGWGMPDYSAVTSVTYPLSSNPYTAPCDGILCPWGKPSDTGIKPIINGVKQDYLRLAELSNGSGGYQGRSIYLSKGDVIYFNTSYSTLNGCVFYPLKGVN